MSRIHLYCLKGLYVFFLRALSITSTQAQADVQHLWFGRRASTRMRSELMTAIYDKALKRKDLSGIVTPQDKDKTKDKASDGKPKAGADIGKIVNLMAGDANRVSHANLIFLTRKPIASFRLL